MLKNKLRAESVLNKLQNQEHVLKRTIQNFS